MNVSTRCFALALALLMALPLTAQAGAKIKIGDEGQIDIGLRLAAQTVFSEKDRRGDGDYERNVDFIIRRARLKIRGDINQYIQAYIQTDFEEQGQTSPDARIIDAYILFKPNKLAWIYVGENMVPSTRQNVTSAGGFMTIDRPGTVYKSLSWGARSKFQFTNEGYGDANAKLATRVAVRDLGATLFGNADFSDTLHLKYYAGIWDGTQFAGSNWFRLCGRAQLNLLDAEKGYYNDGTYIGEKKTIGFGVSYDWQKKVALEEATNQAVDYALFSADAFAELPVGPGSVTGEVAYLKLDLGKVGQLMKLDRTRLGIASRTQGQGGYVQAGYYLTDVKLQPWVAYEQWKSDDKATDRGSYQAYRVGFNYFLTGMDAKLVAGYERFEPKAGLSPNQKNANAVVVGAYFDI